MGRPPFPASTAALPIADALRGSEPLARLADRLRRSSVLLAAVQPALPPALARHVIAGPVDEAGWSLLCANAGVAAKLRQLVPTLEQRLRDAGHVVASIRIKVQPR